MIKYYPYNHFIVVRSYQYMSEIIPNLFLGDKQIAINNIDSMITIVNCANEICDTRFDYKISLYDGNNVVDSKSMDDFVKNMNDAVDYIHTQLEHKIIVLVHCMAGVSRSAAVVTYYLIKHKGYTFDKAYDLLKSKRPIVNLHKWFYDWLKKQKVM